MRVAFLAVGLLLAGSAGADEPRLPFKGVSAVRIANYGAPSKLIGAHKDFAPLVEELNALAHKPWQRGDTKMSCYSTVWIMSGKKNVGLLRIGKDTIVDRQLEKGEATMSLAVGPGDIPRMTQALAAIAPAKCGVPTE